MHRPVRFIKNIKGIIKTNSTAITQNAIGEGQHGGLAQQAAIQKSARLPGCVWHTGPMRVQQLRGVLDSVPVRRSYGVRCDTSTC